MLASNIKQIFIAIGLVLIASIIYVFGTSMIFFSSGNHLELSYLLAIICFMPLGFIVIPHLIAQKNSLYSNEYDIHFSWKSYLLIAVLIFIANLFFIKSNEYFQQMIISACEEFLFRFVLYKILRKHYQYWPTIIITSLLFGFVLHLNYPFMDNLLIRTPAGIVFSLLASHLGLQYAIAGHWLYNLVISQIYF